MTGHPRVLRGGVSLLGLRWTGVAVGWTSVAVVAVLQAQAPAARPPVPGAPAGVTAFVGVNVIPMDTERVLPNQTVLVGGGWITALGPADKVRVPAGATQIDGKGKYLIPGLADMHAHFHGGRDNAGLFSWLAYGVTTIRSMDYVTSRKNKSILELRAAAAAGELLSPRIYTAGGLGVDEKLEKGKTLKLGDVAARVAEYQAQGYDFIKPYDMRAELFDSVAAAARRVGIPLMGHVPDSVSLEQALASGAYRSIEHLTGFYRGGVWNLADADTTRFPALVAATRRAGVWHSPTQGTNEIFLSYRYSIMPVGPQRDSLLARSTLALARARQLIKALHDAGVGLLLGVDAGAGGDSGRWGSIGPRFGKP
jgi:imidazolonepropionase-like amidohydrolase